MAFSDQKRPVDDPLFRGHDGLRADVGAAFFKDAYKGTGKIDSLISPEIKAAAAKAFPTDGSLPIPDLPQYARLGADDASPSRYHRRGWHGARAYDPEAGSHYHRHPRGGDEGWHGHGRRHGWHGYRHPQGEEGVPHHRGHRRGDGHWHQRGRHGRGEGVSQIAPNEAIQPAPGNDGSPATEAAARLAEMAWRGAADALHHFGTSVSNCAWAVQETGAVADPRLAKWVGSGDAATMGEKMRASGEFDVITDPSQVRKGDIGVRKWAHNPGRGGHIFVVSNIIKSGNGNYIQETSDHTTIYNPNGGGYYQQGGDFFLRIRG